MQGVVEKIESGRAYVHLEDGQVLRLLVTDLPPNVRVMSVVHVRVDAAGAASANAADASRKKLNDILSSTPE